MDSQKNNPNTGQFDQVVERLRGANNVLVTVTSNPSVDQLAACIGLTLVLNKLGKHATAVFSGEPPSTIDFLQPEKTLEKNTNSLRDFIISLDKSKADKLRYKVEDQVVKIFITPYKTSISEDDINFSEGDFNVDAVVALGVHDRVQLDQAILAHGRILHDAAVISINNNGGSQLGSLSWLEPNASSLCEMVGDTAAALSDKVFDEQIATALLTGVVAETDRFSNQKASPHTMAVAGVLMAAGASTQLVSTKLEETKNLKEETTAIAEQENKPKQENKDGLITIEHDANEDNNDAKDQAVNNQPSAANPDEPVQTPDVAGAVFDEPDSNDEKPTSPPPEEESRISSGPQIMREPPQRGGQLTANSSPEYTQYSDSTDPLSRKDDNDPILSRNNKKTAVNTDDDDKTLLELEEAVDSPHLHQQAESEDKQKEELGSARDAVISATAGDYKPEPIDALGAQSLGLELHENDGSEDDESPKDKNSEVPPPPVPPPMMPPS